jgi:hypothetical protein
VIFENGLVFQGLPPRAAAAAPILQKAGLRRKALHSASAVAFGFLQRLLITVFSQRVSKRLLPTTHLRGVHVTSSDSLSIVYAPDLEELRSLQPLFVEAQDLYPQVINQAAASLGALYAINRFFCPLQLSFFAGAKREMNIIYSALGEVIYLTK